jgi:RNA polymerase sigma-70 factor (ECF subfamily)
LIGSYHIMGPIMPDDSAELDDRLRRLAAGDQQALAELFAHYRERLRRMIKMRLDRRLQGRVDASDVLQEAYLDVAKRAAEYAADPTMPFFLWLRLLTGQRLLMVHRQHLGAKMRDAGQEVSIYRGALPQASSVSLAAQLLGRMTSPSLAAVRAEMQLKLQEALNGMDPIDREVLVLRHFEELSNGETAASLGLQKAAASNRYIRALKRLKEVLSSMPGFFPE